ncbi:mannose-1-phosphate guanylyltransferase [Burkholderia multivorans]
MQSPIQPVVLCGGSGTRLWPLSRKDLPKQFVPLLGEKSLLRMTLERARRISPSVLTVASEAHRFLVDEACTAADVDATHLLEPVSRNTAAAMALACLHVADDALLLFMPADHHIPDADAFADTIQQGAAAARDGKIVVFGITPRFPNTAFGYIKAMPTPGRDGAHVLAVERFIEKPRAERAQAMLLEGNHYWNAGIFLASARTLKDAFAAHAPDILQHAQDALAGHTRDGRFVRIACAPFERCRADSIDYAVLERFPNIAMVPFHGAWSDVGSWNAVADLLPADAQGNRANGHGVLIDARNTFIHAPTRPVVALGTRDLMIVDTPDATLVATPDVAEQVKDVVRALTEANVPQAVQHRHVPRPWGSYDTVDQGEHFLVKRICVKPHGKLSLQLHHHRAEHWVVVKGTAKVTRGDEVFLLESNQSTYIPVGTRHRLENPGPGTLEIVEIQTGDYLGEDDIVRFEDSYGRLER